MMLKSISPTNASWLRESCTLEALLSYSPALSEVSKRIGPPSSQTLKSAPNWPPHNWLSVVLLKVVLVTGSGYVMLRASCVCSQRNPASQPRVSLHSWCQFSSALYKLLSNRELTLGPSGFVGVDGAEGGI